MASSPFNNDIKLISIVGHHETAPGDWDDIHLIYNRPELQRTTSFIFETTDNCELSAKKMNNYRTLG